MKKLLLACCLLNIGFAQAQRILTTPPSGGNKKAMVGEQIGLTTVTIHYDRPSVKGRKAKFGDNWYSLVFLIRVLAILPLRPGVLVQMKPL